MEEVVTTIVSGGRNDPGISASSAVSIGARAQLRLTCRAKAAPPGQIWQTLQLRRAKALVESSSVNALAEPVAGPGWQRSVDGSLVAKS